MGTLHNPCQRFWDWLCQVPQGGTEATPPLSATLSEVSVSSSPTIALDHALIAILGALSIAVAYYSNSVIKRPSNERRYRRNAGLIFLRSLLPAPVAGFICVATINRIASYTTGDYRYEWAVAFAAGTCAMAIIKKLSGAMLEIELPGSREENP